MAETKKNGTKKNTVAKNPKGNGGSKTTKLADLKVIKLTQEELAAKSAEELADIMTVPVNRISRERGKKLLVKRIAGGKLNSITPEAMMNWTYRKVRVEGVEVKGQGFTPEKAAVNMTTDEYAGLDAARKASLIEAHTHKRRAAEVILPALIRKGLPLSPEDVVYLTCSRVEVEGVTVATQQRASSAIVEGVTFA